MRRFAFLFLYCSMLLSCAKGQKVFANNELEVMKRIEVPVGDGKILYRIEEHVKDNFIKRAIVFTDTGKINPLFIIDGKVIFDGKGKIIADGSEYGDDFYAWSIEINENVIHFNPFWNGGDSASEPIIYVYNVESDKMEEYRIPESEY